MTEHPGEQRAVRSAALTTTAAADSIEELVAAWVSLGLEAERREQQALLAGIEVDRSIAIYGGARWAYRYVLLRQWDAVRPPAIWMMLNPSVATAFADDPTITRVARRSRDQLDAGGYVVVNLFAYRSTSPRHMKAAGDPVGPANDAVIGSLAEAFPDAPWVVGWGAHGGHRGRDRDVATLLAARGIVPTCLAVLSGGHPQHPLMVAGDRTPTVPWAPVVRPEHVVHKQPRTGT